jgi:hypothetical protein
VADLITFLFNFNDENASITNFLNVQIMETGKYKTVIKTQAEYESTLFEDELLGKASDKAVIFIGNILNFS